MAAVPSAQGSYTTSCNSALLVQRDLPYQLDNDLKTIGTTNLNGAVDTDKQYFGAHYRAVSLMGQSV